MGLKFFLAMIMHVVYIISFFLLLAYLMNCNIDSFLLCFLPLEWEWGWGEGRRKGAKKI